MKYFLKSTLLLVLLPKLIQACICYQSESFSLEEYDNAETIVELEIISKNTTDYERLITDYLKDTISYPPREPLIQPSQTDFVVRVLSLFKGDIKNITVLSAQDLGSSCYWEPEVGKKYIFYSKKVLVGDNGSSIEIYGCQRKIEVSSIKYKSEKRVLEVLKAKADGKFIIDQKELFAKRDKSYIVIRGEFNNKEREGVWILYEPIFGEGITNKSNKVLKLKYRNGKLVDSKYSSPTDKFKENAFTLEWRYFYQNEIK